MLVNTLKKEVIITNNLSKFKKIFGIEPSEITDAWWQDKYKKPKSQKRQSIKKCLCPKEDDTCINCEHFDLRTRSIIGYNCKFYKRNYKKPEEYKKQPWDKRCENFIGRVTPINEKMDNKVKKRVKEQHICETCKYGDWRIFGGQTNPQLAEILHPNHCKGCSPIEDKWEERE